MHGSRHIRVCIRVRVKGKFVNTCGDIYFIKLLIYVQSTARTEALCCSLVARDEVQQNVGERHYSEKQKIDSVARQDGNFCSRINFP